MKEWADSPQPEDARGGQVLFFTVARQTFGMQLTRVAQIIDHEEPSGRSKVSRQVILPRGETIKAVDLRSLFKYPRVSEGSKRTIIILEGDRGKIGLVADSIEHIAEAENIQMVGLPAILGEMKYLEGFFLEGKSLKAAINSERIAADFGKVRELKGKAEKTPK